MTALLIAAAFTTGVILAYHLGIETGRCDRSAHGTTDERWGA